MALNQDALSTLFHETDTPRVREAITKLIKRRYPVRRKTPYHIKIFDVNFYLPRERITIDPAIRHGLSGFDALFELLEKKYPKCQTALDLSSDEEN